MKKLDQRQRVMIKSDDLTMAVADAGLPDADYHRISNAVDALTLEVVVALCEKLGHEPMRDMCGKPEHDFCIWCHARLPGAAGPGDAQRASGDDCSRV